MILKLIEWFAIVGFLIIALDLLEVIKTIYNERKNNNV